MAAPRTTAEGPPECDEARGKAGSIGTADNTSGFKHIPTAPADQAALPVGVFCEKSSGALVLWKRYATRAEALQIVGALARVGCAARIVLHGDEVRE